MSTRSPSSLKRSSPRTTVTDMASYAESDLAAARIAGRNAAVSEALRIISDAQIDVHGGISKQDLLEDVAKLKRAPPPPTDYE